MKSTQRVSQLELDQGHIQRQHSDEWDRMDRELRRSHSDISAVVMENRRLKALLAGYGSHASFQDDFPSANASSVSAIRRYGQNYTSAEADLLPPSSDAFQQSNQNMR